MKMQIDLGVLGLVDCEVSASMEKVRGRFEIEIGKVEVIFSADQICETSKNRTQKYVVIDILPMMLPEDIRSLEGNYFDAINEKEFLDSI